jgi:hypothetical protein
VLRGCVFSPKGWDNIAQGNALGGEWYWVSQPEGLRQENSSQAFSLQRQITLRTWGVAPG